MSKHLKNGKSPSLYPTVKKVIKQTVTVIEAYHICQLRLKFFHILLLRLTPYAGKLIGNN